VQIAGSPPPAIDQVPSRAILRDGAAVTIRATTPDGCDALRRFFLPNRAGGHLSALGKLEVPIPDVVLDALVHDCARTRFLRPLVGRDRPS
jgi:hypothetical protein